MTAIFSLHDIFGILARAALCIFSVSTVAAQKLTPHRISLANGKSFELNLPEGYEISVAAQGLKRVRFMALSPDNRLFVTDMYNLTDNRRGVVYILDQFDPNTHQFKKVTKYLTDCAIQTASLFTKISRNRLVLSRSYRSPRSLSLRSGQRRAFRRTAGARDFS